MPIGLCMWSRRGIHVFSLLSSCLSLTACSGAAPTELFGPLGRSEGATEPVGGGFGDEDDEATGGTSSGSGATGTGAAGSGSSGSGANAGAAGSDDADDENDDPPAPTCTKEIEPNDEPDEATVFTACVGGVVARGDVDHASVVAPANAERVRIVHAESGGKVTYRVFVGDIEVPSLEDDDMPPYVPFVAGARYRFEMRAAEKGGGGPRAYEVRVLFE